MGAKRNFDLRILNRVADILGRPVKGVPGLTQDQTHDFIAWWRLQKKSSTVDHFHSKDVVVYLVVNGLVTRDVYSVLDKLSPQQLMFLSKEDLIDIYVKEVRRRLNSFISVSNQQGYSGENVVRRMPKDWKDPLAYSENRNEDWYVPVADWIHNVKITFGEAGFHEWLKNSSVIEKHGRGGSVTGLDKYQAWLQGYWKRVGSSCFRV